MTYDCETHVLLRTIREARFIHGVTCLRCGASHVQRWGKFSGRQRYRCTSCHRTFSDLTDTAASYLKKLTRLPAYAELMCDAEALRVAARRSGISTSTAFRWRHRLLRYKPPCSDIGKNFLEGIVEVVETGFACVGRPPAVRWGPDRQPPPTVFVMRNRERLVHQQRIERERGCIWDYDQAFTMVGADATIVCARGPLSPAGRAVQLRRKRGYETSFRHSRTRHRSPGRALYHTRNTIEFIVREKRWLRRFRGVGFRWLQNYLFWFQMCDEATRAPDFTELLMWPVYDPEFVPTLPENRVRGV